MNSRFSHLISGLAGGALALVLAVLLVGAGVIDVGGLGGATGAQDPVTRAPSNKSGGKTVAEIYEEVAPGVVYIEARGVAAASPFGLPGEEGGAASGSGFVLDDEGRVLTNAHVVDGADGVTVRFEEREIVDAKIIGVDLSSDLAVLQVDPEDVNDLQPLELGDSDSLEVGDPAIAVGNPFGFDRTVTTGIISAVQRQIRAPNGFSIDNVIQTDAAINPGNSGGPLLDGEGRVIGINSQIATGGSNGSVGIGFAVPINTAKIVVPELENDGEFERSFLGVTTAPVTPQIAEDLNLPRDSGALVQDVVENGPADEAGIRAGRTETTTGLVAGGDLIVGIDGQDVVTPEDVAAAIADLPPGETVEIEFYRGGELQTAEIELGKRPRTAASALEPPRGGGEQPPPGILPFP